MAKTTTITFGGQNYVVHAFNIGELERITEEVEKVTEGGAKIKLALAVIGIAMERAEPPVTDFKSIEVDSLAEITAASAALLELAGLKKPDENPPESAGAP